MRFSLFAIAAASAGFVAAQDLSQIPACAIPCFASATQASGCALTDIKCQCTTGQAKITESLTQCLPSKCSASDIANVGTAAAKLCAAAGVSVTVPSGTPVLSGSAAATSAAGNASRSASMTMSASRSASATPATSTGGAAAIALNLGAVVFGVAAFAL